MIKHRRRFLRISFKHTATLSTCSSKRCIIFFSRFTSFVFSMSNLSWDLIKCRVTLPLCFSSPQSSDVQLTLDSLNQLTDSRRDSYVDEVVKRRLPLLYCYNTYIRLIYNGIEYTYTIQAMQTFRCICLLYCLNQTWSSLNVSTYLSLA